MGRWLALLVVIIAGFPYLVRAELLRLTCTVEFGGLSDNYTLEVDLDSGVVNSTYHAAAIGGNVVTMDYRVASQATFEQDRIVFPAKLHALDYTFELNKTTLGITRYMDTAKDEDVGRGSCQRIELPGRVN